MKLHAVYRWVLLATVFLTPLAYTPGVLIDFFNVPKVTLLFLGTMIAGTLRMILAMSGASSRQLQLLARPATAVGVAFVLSWAFSPYKAFALLGLYSRFGGLLPYLAVILLGLLLADAFAGRTQPLVWAFVASAAGVGLFGLVQMLFLGAHVAVLSDTGYITSTVGHSNFTGGFLAIALPLAVALWIQPGTSRWGMAATVPIAASLIFTVSQGAWAAGTAGILVLLGMRTQWKALARLAYAAAVSCAAIATGAVIASLFIPHAYARLPAVLGTAVSRGFLWRSAASAGLDRPLTGWGPNALAIEAPLHRSVEDALLLNFVKGDDPHSLPLAVFGNLGIIGLAAFIYLVFWTWRLWRAGRGGDHNPVRCGIFASLAAYGVQSLVSLDEPTVRSSLWILLAAAAASRATKTTVSLNRLRMVPSLALVMIAAGPTGATLASVPLADHLALRAERQLADGEIASGRTTYSTALALRDDTTYRRRFGTTLAGALLDEIVSAETALPVLAEIFAYLEDFPDAQATAIYADLLKSWGAEEPRVLSKTLNVYDSAVRLDPHNPLLAVERADIYLLQNRPDVAEQSLVRFEHLLLNKYPEYAGAYDELWFSLAIARSRQGAVGEAALTLRRARSRASCRYVIAAQTVSPTSGGGAVEARLLCPQVLMKLLPADTATT